MTPIARIGITALLAAPLVTAQDAPKVTKLLPAHMSVEVDANKTKRLEIHFAEPMSQTGHSFCGGGPQFPKFKARPSWKNRKTMIIEVELEPDHLYTMSLNCPSAKNFRSAKGVALTPTPWSFTTLPAKLPNQKQQRKLNAESFAALGKVLPAKYSYYEHKKLEWDKIFARSKARILAAKTTKGWTAAVARMLKPANDIHMCLRVDGQTVGTGSRRIDPLYRAGLLKKYLPTLRQPMHGVITGETKDGIGYLMISGFAQSIDFDAVEELIVGMKGAKALIIDVRPNSGGGENLAQQVAQWFVPGTKVYAKHATRKGKGAKNFYSVSRRRIVGKPKKERFGKPVAVLMSRYCMSSCEAFLLMMRQAEHCKLIGQRSYGSSGNPKGHTLPNGVEIVLPSWKVMRLDSSCFEDEGLVPDIEVKATAEDLEKRDPILEKALAHLRK